MSDFRRSRLATFQGEHDIIQRGEQYWIDWGIEHGTYVVKVQVDEGINFVIVYENEQAVMDVWEIPEHPDDLKNQ